ncbi:hypothetical protein [Archangium lipolyticum]|uniref:hypothetical protein n=1 Tax=Archangium lipolyticum TaxID=2970465 RepID=UPI00214A6E9B|nr:hypothetical protein [Archangium lipolyticum]
MKKNMNVMMGLVAASLLGPASALAQTCPSFEELARASLPTEVGDAAIMGRLLSASATTQLSSSFDATLASRSVGDTLAAETTCTSTRCNYRNTTGSALKVDLTRGKVTYLNRTRSELERTTTLSEGAAYEASLRAAQSFGVPAGELDTQTPVVRAMRSSTKDPVTGRGTSTRTEMHVWMKRRVQGFPVYGSKVHTAVDPNGQVARMHVRWSDFRLSPGLRATDTLPRDKVYEELVMQLRASNTPCALGQVKSYIAYVPTRLVEGGAGLEEERTYRTVNVSQDEYIPALVVRAAPVEQPEDSGRPVDAGQELFIPLLGGGER